MAENGLAEGPKRDDGRSDGGVGWWERLRESSLKAFVAWALSVLLAVVLITALLLLFEPKDWHEFFVGVTAEIVGAVAVALALTPAFLAIRAFANDKFGRVRDFERFPYSEFTQRLVKCDDLVRIMDTSSSVIDESTATGEEAMERRRCVTSLRELLRKRNSVAVEVLLLDPTSDAARQRSADLKAKGIDIAAGVGRNLALLNKIRLELPRGARPKLLVKLYNSTPSCAYYRVDERTSIAFYALQTASEQGAHVDVALKSVLGKIVNDHFRDIRDHAHSIDFLTYLYGTASVAGRQERVAWVEVPVDPEEGEGGPKLLFLALNGKENSATWRAVRRAGETVGLAFAAYKRPEARYTVSEVIAAGDDPRLLRLARAKYGVEFEFFFAMAEADDEVEDAAGDAVAGTGAGSVTGTVIGEQRSAPAAG
jgi:hypothetical protein